MQGTDLVLNCSAVGDPEPTYQWLRSGSALPSKVTDANTAQLVIPSMTWSDVGVYYCLAVNDGGVSYSPAIYVLLQAEQGAVISNRSGILPNTDFSLSIYMYMYINSRSTKGTGSESPRKSVWWCYCCGGGAVCVGRYCHLLPVSPCGACSVSVVVLYREQTTCNEKCI